VAADRAAILLTGGKSPGFERTDRKSLPFGLEPSASSAPSIAALENGKEVENLETLV
jgi:hypothetical protein